MKLKFNSYEESILNNLEMAQVNKLFFIPIGLPGMGKTTLSRHLEHTSVKYLNKNYQYPFKLSYKHVSYDKILTDILRKYQVKNPDVPFHDIIDIVRSKAD